MLKDTAENQTRVTRETCGFPALLLLLSDGATNSVEIESLWKLMEI